MARARQPQWRCVLAYMAVDNRALSSSPALAKRRHPSSGCRHLCTQLLRLFNSYRAASSSLARTGWSGCMARNGLLHRSTTATKGHPTIGSQGIRSLSASQVCELRGPNSCIPEHYGVAFSSLASTLAPQTAHEQLISLTMLQRRRKQQQQLLWTFIRGAFLHRSAPLQLRATTLAPVRRWVPHPRLYLLRSRPRRRAEVRRENTQGGRNR